MQVPISTDQLCNLEGLLQWAELQQAHPNFPLSAEGVLELREKFEYYAFKARDYETDVEIIS